MMGELIQIVGCRSALCEAFHKADEQAEQSRGRVAGSGLLICRSWLTICPCRGARIWPEVCVRHGAGEQSGKSPSERVTAYHVVA